MRAVSVQPDPRLAELAGGVVAWRYGAQVPASAPADAIDWARAAFEGAPLPMRLFLVVGWKALMLERGLRSDATLVLGWPVAQTTPEMAVLQRSSRLGIEATLLFATRPEGATFSSAIVYTNRLGRMVWAVIAPIHRWAVRVVLSHASTVITR